MSENKLANAPNTIRDTLCQSPTKSSVLTLYTPHSPEQRLPFHNLMTTFSNAGMPDKPISLLQLGQVIADQYTIAGPVFAQDFSKYQNQRAMGPVRQALKEGMDQISCDYVVRHESALEIAKHIINMLSSPRVFVDRL